MNKMLFLNIGWMKNYQGLENDSIAGGGEFVQQFNDGSEPDNYPPCEIRNFEPYKGRSIPAPPPIFRADHPFVFLIRENSTGSILFLGRVVDPTLKTD